MKWIDGGSLAQALASGRWPAGQPDSFRRAAQLMVKVARAVHDAHQHGILHRDLKPANILLDLAEEPYVSDFGLARSLGDIDLSSTGEIAGTPCYMSPEQAAGGTGLTTKVDVYGLGAVLAGLSLSPNSTSGNAPNWTGPTSRTWCCKTTTTCAATSWKPCNPFGHDTFRS